MERAAPKCRARAAGAPTTTRRARSASRARSSADSRVSTSTAPAGSRSFPARRGPERSRAAQRLLLAIAPLEAPDYERGLAHARPCDPARCGVSAQVTSTDEASSFPPRRALRRGARRARPGRGTSRSPSAARRELRPPARTDRAQGRQRRAQYGRPVHRLELLRAAAEDRDRARCRRSALRSRGFASVARAAATAVEGRPARSAAGRGLPRAQPLALPLDRDLGHGVEERRIPAGRLARAHVRGRAAAARVRGRRRHRRLERSGPARRHRRARGRARQHGSVPAPRAARVSRGSPRNKALEHIVKVEADIVQAAAHLDARHAFRSRISARRLRRRHPHRVPGRRESRRRCRRSPDAVRFRHARRPARDAGAAARRRSRKASSR